MALLKYAIPFIVAFIAGYYAALRYYEPQIVELRSQLLAADTAARAAKVKYKENENEIAIELDASVARINEYHNSVLQGQRSLYTAALAKCAEKAAGTAQESQALGSLSEFEAACAEDANTVILWSDWATKNGLPTGD